MKTKLFCAMALSAFAISLHLGASNPKEGFVAHEWGTFTSFSGSDGVPVSFMPNNEDLPGFVYYPIN